MAITIAVFFQSYLMEIEEFDNIQMGSGIGNYLSNYFHQLGRSILNQKDFVFDVANVNFTPLNFLNGTKSTQKKQSWDFSFPCKVCL